MLKFRAIFWTPFPGHHNNLKCFPHSREKQWWRGEKSAIFFRPLPLHVDTFTIYNINILFRAPRCSKKRCKKHPPSLDQARFIFAWLALLSRCPYYLSALQRLVYNALMYLKKHTRMLSLSRSSEHILIWCPVALRQKFSSYHGRLQISRPY